jgi:integrase
MATVNKRRWKAADGKFKEAWRIAYTDREGKRRFEQVPTKRQADARRIQIEGDLNKGVHVADAATITVAEACDLWIAAGEADGLEWGTLKQRRTLCRLHIKPLIGDRRLARLTVPEIETFRDALVATRPRVTSAKTVRALSSVLNEAMRRGLLGQNVATNVKVKNKSRDEEPVAIPDRGDLKGIITAALSLGNDIPEVHPMLLLDISTGLRGSELRGLRWPDLDFKTNTVNVRQRADERCILGKLKSKAAYRTIPVATEVMMVMKAWKLRCPPSQDDLVFPNREGKPIHPNSLREDRWQPVLIRAELTRKTERKDSTGRWIHEHKYGMHHLRHACASRWIRQNVDLKSLTRWMGHSSVAITINIYGHLLKDEERDAAIVAASYAELMA